MKSAEETALPSMRDCRRCQRRNRRLRRNASVRRGSPGWRCSSHVPATATAVAPAGVGEGQPGIDPQRDPNGPQRKLDFVAQAPSLTINLHRIQARASPYQVMADSVITASLMTGLRFRSPRLANGSLWQLSSRPCSPGLGVRVSPSQGRFFDYAGFGTLPAALAAGNGPFRAS